MEQWQGLLWVAGLAGAAVGVYGVHRLCLWLEARGHLYYLNKKSSSSPMTCLTAVQQALEPQTHHIIQIKDQRAHSAALPGADDPPTPAPGDSDRTAGTDWKQG